MLRMMRKKVKKEKAMNEEFYMPEGIIHHIMCYLNPQQSAQVAVLSKPWLSAWKTNPKLEFHDKYFHCTGSLEEIQEFRHYIKITLARYEEEDINILEFNLDHASFNLDDDDTDSFLNQQLQRAIKKGVKVIRLSINSHRYIVPSFILEAKSLTDLSLTGCKFQAEKLFLCNIRSLHLKEVHIDEETFSKIICPLIDDLLIQRCECLNTIKLINLPKLKKLDVLFSGKSRSPTIEIDAPWLETLKFEHPYRGNFPELQSSKTLRYLQLTKTHITDMFFDNLMRNFPGIQVLKLNSCYGFKRMNVASKSLKHLCLYSTPLDVKEVQLDAPNMTKFEYGGITFGRLHKQIRKSVFSRKCISLISTTPSCHWHSTSTDHHASSSWFRKLNELISNLSPSKISLSLFFWVLFSNPMYMGDIHTFAANANANANANAPPQVEELNLDITYSGKTSLKYSSFLDGVFWPCQPKAIVLQNNSRDKKFTEFLYNELIKEIRNRKPCNLSRSSVKFWQHGLKEVELEIIDKAGITTQYYPQEHSELILPFNTLKVVFKLEWNV